MGSADRDNCRPAMTGCLVVRGWCSRVMGLREWACRRSFCIRIRKDGLMSLRASAGASGRGTGGRRPKGGIPRAVVQSKLPKPLQEELFRLADVTALSVSDLAAYYLITGWNR